MIEEHLASSACTRIWTYRYLLRCSWLFTCGATLNP